MISLGSMRVEFQQRMTVVDQLIDETHPASPAVGPISREARGLAIVLLFAAYENLLTSLTRELLEAAVSLRVGNRRLQPGFRAFALADAVKSIRESSEKKVFASALPRLVELAGKTSAGPTINTDAFPSDGSFMKRSQVSLWCSIFQVGEPRQLLSGIWGSLDAVVAQRNGIAHGRLTPDQVGRDYTEFEIRDLKRRWAGDWDSFIVHVESLAQDRSFFRVER